jgi:hypothetical protein
MKKLNWIVVLSLVLSQAAFAEEGKVLKSAGGAVEGVVVSVIPPLAMLARNIPVSKNDMGAVATASLMFSAPCALAGGALVHALDGDTVKASREWLANHRILGGALSLVASTAASTSVLVTEKLGFYPAAAISCALGGISGAAISGATLAKKVDATPSCAEGETFDKETARCLKAPVVRYKGPFKLIISSNENSNSAK